MRVDHSNARQADINRGLRQLLSWCTAAAARVAHEAKASASSRCASDLQQPLSFSLHSWVGSQYCTATGWYMYESEFLGYVAR
eukprot:COSAG05_NODE_2337_length_3213_cov_3.423892_1_plen_83_part_00